MKCLPIMKAAFDTVRMWLLDSFRTYSEMQSWDGAGRQCSLQLLFHECHECHNRQFVAQVRCMNGVYMSHFSFICFVEWVYSSQQDENHFTHSPTVFRLLCNIYHSLLHTYCRCTIFFCIGWCSRRFMTQVCISASDTRGHVSETIP